jgi:hypothetical protein
MYGSLPEKGRRRKQNGRKQKRKENRQREEKRIPTPRPLEDEVIRKRAE